MFVFKPSLWRDGLLYELPRPITSLRIQDAWDYARFKVPLRNGDAIAGPSRNGVDVALEGQCGSRSGALTLDEAAMFAALEELRARLHVNDSSAAFEFFLYHDPATSTYRSLRNCLATRFEYDLSDPHLFTYSLVIHAADATIHSAAPS